MNSPSQLNPCYRVKQITCAQHCTVILTATNQIRVIDRKPECPIQDHGLSIDTAENVVKLATDMHAKHLLALTEDGNIFATIFFCNFFFHISM